MQTRYPPRPTYPQKPWPKRPAHLPSGAHVGGRPAMRHSELDDKIYATIIDYAGEHGGHTPTRREICSLANVSSTSVVSHHIKRLIGRGMLEVRDRKLIVCGATWTPPERGADK